MPNKFKKQNVMIICGGRGKRMGKFTNKLPKSLLKVGKKTILEHKLNYYKKEGFENFIFCIGYKGNIIKKFLKKKNDNSIFSDGGSQSGILKRIYLARKEIKSSTLISYGDTLAKINFKDLIKKHKKSKGVLSLVAAPIQNPFGIVNWNHKYRAISFKEKPILNHFIGYAVLEPRIFDYLSPAIINMKNGNGLVRAIQLLISKRLVNIYKYEGLQLTVNSITELKEARKKIGKYFTYDEKF